MEEKNILNLEDSLSYLLPDYKNTTNWNYNKINVVSLFKTATLDSILCKNN